MKRNYTDDNAVTKTHSKEDKKTEKQAVFILTVSV